MGLSIHYSGSFNPDASLASMIEEVKDIAEIYKWEYHIFQDAFPANRIENTEYTQDIYGICFTPPECETVYLCFLSNMKISSPAHLKFFGNSKNQNELQYLYMLSVKTQNAGTAIHKLIIHLFKYLNDKYLKEFKLSDEGNYWETGDEKLLTETFRRYNILIESFASSIEIYPKLPGESFESYFERLLRQIQNKNKG